VLINQVSAASPAKFWLHFAQVHGFLLAKYALIVSTQKSTESKEYKAIFTLYLLANN